MKSLLIRRSSTITIFIIVSFVLGSCGTDNIVPKPAYKHDVTDLNGATLIWSLNNIYATQNDFEPMISASDGLLCILGDVVYPPKMGLSCIDSLTGKTNWQTTVGISTAILAVHDGIYVTYGSRPGIDKYDFTGKIIWSHSFTGTGVLYIYSYGNQIQLFMHPERFLVLDSDSGNIIDDLKGKEVIFSTATERFALSFGIDSMPKDLSQINWHTEIRDTIRLAPLFTDRFVFQRTGRVVGTLLAIDRTNGQVIWKTDNNVISNIITLQSRNEIVFLTRDGKLLAVDQNNGSQTRLAEFSRPPFTLNGDDIVGGYELALDEKNKILFVLLGDSRQLFAFQID